MTTIWEYVSQVIILFKMFLLHTWVPQSVLNFQANGTHEEKCLVFHILMGNIMSNELIS